MNPEDQLWLTLHEAATLAGVDQSTLRESIRDDRLLATKRANRWFVRRSEIERYIRDRRPWYPPKPTEA